jgi:Zn-dependent protease with chaperone function
MFETVLYRCSAKFDVSSEHITRVLSETADTTDIEFNKSDLQGYEGSFRGKVSGRRHAVEITPREGHYMVTEEISVSLRWHLLFLIPIALLTLFQLNLEFQAYTSHNYLRAALTIASSTSILVWTFSSTSRTTLITQASSENFDRKNEYSYLEASIILIGVLFIFLGISVTLGFPLTLLYSLLSVLSVLVLLHLYSVLNGGLYCEHFFQPQLDRVLPAFTLKLALVEVMTIVGAAAVVFYSSVIAPRLRLLNKPIYTVTSIIIISITAVILLGLLLFVRDVGGKSYFDFLQTDQPEIGSLARIVSTIVVVLISYALLFSGYRVFELVFLDTDTLLLVRISGVLALGAITYFPAGVSYQTVSYLRKIRETVSASEDAELTFETGYSARRLSFPETDSTVYFAAAISTGFNQYIILSDDLIDDFDESELQAVAFHETAHIENGETRIALLVVLGSMLTFVGRNLLYAQFNFREREFRADNFAVERVGRDSVVDALRKVEESNLPNGGQITGLGVSSFGGFSERTEAFDQYFDLFFGDYAIREAHPTVEARIEKLDE